MLNFNGNPACVLAGFTAAAAAADGLGVHPVLVLAASAGLVYLALLAVNPFRRASSRRNSRMVSE